MTNPAVRFHASRMSLPLSLMLCAAVVALAFPPRLQAQTVNPNTTSWFGNTYIPGTGSYKTGLWVPDTSDGLFEWPATGTVFVNSVYDESHRDAAIYTVTGLDLYRKNNDPYPHPSTSSFADTHG